MRTKIATYKTRAWAQRRADMLATAYPKVNFCVVPSPICFGYAVLAKTEPKIAYVLRGKIGVVAS